MSGESCLSSPIAGKADLVAEDSVAGRGGRRLDGPIGTLAGRQHGVVARRQLRELGFNDSAIDSRLRRGALLALHRGVYAVGHRKLTIQ